MSDVTVTNLFPTPVMRVNNGLSREVLAELTRAATQNSNLSNNRAAALQHSEIQDSNDENIGTLLNGCVQPHIAELGRLLFGQTLNWSIKEYWFNKLQRGGAQSVHSHANSFISGIVFLTRSDPSARTVFHRSLGSQHYSFVNAGPDVQIGEHNADHWVSPAPEPGSMLLYPSHLLHEVPRNEGAERLTMAFNAIPDYLDSHGYRIHFSSKSSLSGNTAVVSDED